MSTTTTADWLQRHLVATGRANSDGIGRDVRASTCPHCRSQIVTGLDADVAGLPVRCDPQPIDAVGELLALATGRRTFDLTRDSRGPHLDYRPTELIRSGRRRGELRLAEHACGQPLPLATDGPLSQRPPATFTEEPDF